MTRLLPALCSLLILAACSGVPLTSWPRLMSLSNDLMEADPAEFTLAVEVDKRVSPTADAVPYFQLAITPAQEGAFDPIVRNLPMQFETAESRPPGLKPAGPNRQWLLYSFPPSSQDELRRIRTSFEDLRAEQEGKENGGGSVSIGIEQAHLAVNDPALADTRWETWLKTSVHEGYFEIWSGSLDSLRAQAENAAKRNSSVQKQNN